MKNYLILVLIILGASNANSQWTEVVTPSSYHLYCVETVTDDIVFAGGHGGSLVRTTDAGANWESISIGSADWINAIHFSSVTDGWMATSSGASSSAHLLKTTDGGLNWVSALSADEYTSMSWPSASTGYVGTWSGTVVKTIDGGLNWSTVTSPTTSNIPKIQFLDAQNGFAVSTDYYMHRTQDGGATWESFYHSGIRSVFFQDVNNGFCIDSYGRIGKTSDGGETFTYWQSTFVDYKLQDMHFSGPLTGYVVGGLDCGNGSCVNKPVILTTSDGGITWINDTNHPLVGQTKGLYEIDCTPNGTPFIAGSNSIVLKNDAIAGLPDLNGENSVIVNPNPNAGQFSVSLPNNTQTIRIHSITGKLVYEEQMGQHKKVNIDITTVEKGVYFLSIGFINGTSQRERLIVN
jgi:photosystem II stability/assembly factor-like uncharacterized protein